MPQIGDEDVTWASKTGYYKSLLHSPIDPKFRPDGITVADLVSMLG